MNGWSLYSHVVGSSFSMAGCTIQGHGFDRSSPCAERRTSGREASSVTGSAMQREFAALIMEQTQAIQKLEQGGASVKVSLQRLV